MKKTLAYYSTVLYKEFLSYTQKELYKINLNYGALPFVLYIGKHPQCSPSELTAALRADWGHSQRSITKLEKEGFILRERSREGSRNYHLSLTEKGEQAFGISHQVFQVWDEKKLDVLEPEEKEELFRILSKLTN